MRVGAADLRGRLVRRARRSSPRRRAPSCWRVHQRLALPRGQGRRARGAHGRARPRAGPAAGLCAPGGRAGRGGVRRRIVRAERRRALAGACAELPGRPRSTCNRAGRRPSRSSSARHRCTSAAPRPSCGTRWCWACATTSARMAFPACCWACRAASTRRWCWPIAVDALGRDKVRAVMMPSPYTADISWIDARDMAARLGVRYDEISITPMFEAFKACAGAGVQGPARGRDRGEHPGAHPRHAADGAVEQVRLASC